jgi:hypothetical protein
MAGGGGDRYARGKEGGFPLNVASMAITARVFALSGGRGTHLGGEHALDVGALARGGKSDGVVEVVP